MGGCASKPKGLKADLDMAPALAKEESSTVSEVKIDAEPKEIGEVKKIEGEQEAKIVTETKEIEEVKKIEGEPESKIEEVEGEEKVVKMQDGDVDEQGNKRRSLSLLFKENEEGTESTENEKTTQIETIPLELIKEVEELKTENASEEFKATVPETKKIENPIEENPVPVVVAPETVEVEKPTESAQALETGKAKISEEKKANEEKVVATKDVNVTEKALDVDIRQEQPVLSVSSAGKVPGEVAETK